MNNEALLLRDAFGRTHRDRGRYQDGLPQARDAVPPGSQSGRPRCRAPVQGSQRSLRSPQGSRQARRLRSFRSRRLRARHGQWRCRLRRRFRHHLLRSVRRHFRHVGRRPQPRLGPRARRRSALQHGDHAPGSLRRQDRADPHSDLRHLRGLFRLRRQGRHQAQSLRDVRRPGPRSPRARLLHPGAHLPELSWPRPVDRQSLRLVLRFRPRDPRTRRCR